MTLHDESAVSPTLIVGLFAVLSVVYVSAKFIYNLYSNPLNQIPGPKINAITRIPYVRHLLNGTTVNGAVALHEKYGEVVRLSPNQVSFTDGESAWQDIYGFRTGKLKGHANMQKDPVWYPLPINGAKSVLLADDENHTRGRRVLAHAFSSRALAEQEPLVQRYVDQLVDRLKETSANGKKAQDMTKWYNWTTFDVIADLTFGEPFGCLHDQSTHHYITMLLSGIKVFHFSYIKTHFPIVKYLGSLIIDQKGDQKRRDFDAWVHSQVQKRMQAETERPDFMTYILSHNGEKGASLTEKEMDSNASLLLIAGSETTATLLSGATYCLLRNPDKLEKLKQEVRGRWKDYNDITMADVSNAPYLVAVLNESLRYLPPVPAGFERQVGKGGEFVSGYYLPEGTAVSMSHYAAYHSEKNFENADQFVPERWLDDPEYANDKRAALQPFSFGPRNCLGKNLAYAEMRLIVAKMIWTFDMELDASCRDWMQRCSVYTVWHKPELLVTLKEVVRNQV